MVLIGRCPSTVPPVFPVLVFQLSKQQNRTRTTFSTVLGTPPNRTRTKKSPLEELWGGCFVSWALNRESTKNWDFHRAGTVHETVLGHFLILDAFQTQTQTQTQNVQRFSYAIYQIAPLPPVVALSRRSKSQITAT